MKPKNVLKRLFPFLPFFPLFILASPALPADAQTQTLTGAASSMTGQGERKDAPVAVRAIDRAERHASPGADAADRPYRDSDEAEEDEGRTARRTGMVGFLILAGVLTTGWLLNFLAGIPVVGGC